MMTWYNVGLMSMGFLIFGPHVSGDDLSKIERLIKKEPAYKSTPRYCLLVFGPEADKRVWLVLDGDVLYIDRNGNGDLTEAGERLSERLVDKEPGPIIAESHYFVDLRDPAKPDFSDLDRDVPTLNGTNRYRRFSVSYSVLKKVAPPQTPKEEASRKELERRIEGVINVYVWVGRTLQCGRARFAARASDAPILHFDGPMRFELMAPRTGEPLGGETNQLVVRLMIPGLGRDTVTLLRNFAGVPEDTHPIAEIEFPSKQSGAPVRKTIKLDHRC
jgi:hypothetical protein